MSVGPHSKNLDLESNDHGRIQKCDLCISVCKTDFTDHHTPDTTHGLRDSVQACRIQDCYSTIRKNFRKILKSKVHSDVSECASSWIMRFDKLKKACFRSCVTFRWSKVDSDILFWSQKLILTIWMSSGNLTDWKPENVWNKHHQFLSELKLCGIWLVCPNVTYISMFARAVPVAYTGNIYWKFLKYICFMLVSLHF